RLQGRELSQPVQRHSAAEHEAACRHAEGGGAMSRAIQWLTEACKSNRPFRTFWQAACSFLVVSAPSALDGGGDLMLAFRALLVGAIAAGISALWKTAEDDQNEDQGK
ncbi:MAG: hypothetical protein ACI36Y_07220, partial [Coriobacteriales bacterium]